MDVPSEDVPEFGIVEVKPVDLEPDQISVSYGVQWTPTVIEYFLTKEDALEATRAVSSALWGDGEAAVEPRRLLRLEERRTWIEE